MVSEASKKKAAQKKAAAAAKRGSKAAAAPASSKAAATESQNGANKLADGVEALQISDRTCTGVLCSHPQSRDIRVSNFFTSPVSKLYCYFYFYYFSKIGHLNFNLKWI